MTEKEGLQPAERLWTPWRMAYVGGETVEPGCVFCNALANRDDAGTFIVHRGESAFVMMNLYPYNTGHLMIIPNDHQDDLARLRLETRAEIAELSASFCTGLRLALRCEGFNTGMNLGDVAGAGIADHLHQHIVPRWRGDANFMPIVGSTKVLPELIPATYAKLRADVARQKSGAQELVVIPLHGNGTEVVLHQARLPRVPLEDGSSAWAEGIGHLRTWAATVSLLGWAGPESTDEDALIPPALAVTATIAPDAATAFRAVPVGEALETVAAGDGALIAACLARGFATVREEG